MGKLELRYQRVGDAKKFYEILNNPNFLYFSAKPKSIEEEKEFLKGTQQKRRNNFEHNFTILYNKKIVGGCGIKINQHRKHIGEIGYFLDYDYWGKGIATKIVRILEGKGKKIGVKRFEIYVFPKNKSSVKVALKNKYEKEALVKKSHFLKGKLVNMELYVKCH